MRKKSELWDVNSELRESQNSKFRGGNKKKKNRFARSCFFSPPQNKNITVTFYLIIFSHNCELDILKKSELWYKKSKLPPSFIRSVYLHLVSASDVTKRLMHMAHLSGNTSGVLKSSSDWLDYTGFPGDTCFAFFNVLPGNKDAVAPNPLTKEESHRVYKCDDEHLSRSNKRWIFKSMWNI